MPEKFINLNNIELFKVGEDTNSLVNLTLQILRALCLYAVFGTKETWPQLCHWLALILDGMTSVRLTPLLQRQG